MKYWVLSVLVFLSCSSQTPLIMDLEPSIDKEFCSDIDFDNVRDDYNGPMFYVNIVNWANSKIQLLGFEPVIYENNNNLERKRSSLLLFVGARGHASLFILQVGSDLYATEILSSLGSVGDRHLTPSEIFELFAKYGEKAFVKVHEDKIYTDERFYDTLIKNGVVISDKFVKVPEIHVQPLSPITVKVHRDNSFIVPEKIEFAKREVVVPDQFKGTISWGGIASPEVRYLGMYDKAYWQCMNNYAKDIDYVSKETDYVANGHGSAISGWSKGYRDAEEDIKYNIKHFGKEKTHLAIKDWVEGL